MECYALQCIEAKDAALKTNSQISNKINVNLEELKTFLGVLFPMGLIHKPDLKSCWSTERVLAMPYFAK